MQAAENTHDAKDKDAIIAEYKADVDKAHVEQRVHEREIKDKDVLVAKITAESDESQALV